MKREEFSYSWITISAMPAVATFLRGLLERWNQTGEVISFLAFITSTNENKMK